MAGKRKTGKHRWWPGLLAAFLIVVLALFVTVHRHLSPPLSQPKTSIPAPANARVTVGLGSYGSGVPVNGRPEALVITPVAVLGGSGIWRKEDLPPAQVQETIANDFLRFPGLGSLMANPATQAALSRKLEQDLTQILAEHAPGWHIEGLELHPRLGPIPHAG